MMSSTGAGSVTLFFEYRIDPEQRESFLRHLDDLIRETARIGSVERHEILEGADQPGLFVEIIRTGDLDAARRIEQHRSGRNGEFFRRWDGWIAGNGVRAWTFRKVKESR
jgi:hypothetical protein